MKIRDWSWLYYLVRLIGTPLFRMAFRFEIEGRHNLPAEGPMLIVSKHLSLYDIPAVALLTWKHIRFAAKSEMFINPLARNFFLRCGAVPVYRRKSKSSKRDSRNKNSFEYLKWLAAQKKVIACYPEGTWVFTHTARAKLGVVKRVLVESGVKVPVVPVGIEYQWHTFPRSRCIVRVGRPEYHDPSASLSAFMKGIMKRVAELSNLEYIDMNAVIPPRDFKTPTPWTGIRSPMPEKPVFEENTSQKDPVS